MDLCDRCAYFAYDDYEEAYLCTVAMDEDDVYRLGAQKQCPYFRDGDEYAVVRKQN